MNNLLIVEEHEVVRIGLRNALQKTEINIVAESASANHLLKQVQETDADMLLVNSIINKTTTFAELETLLRYNPAFPVLMHSTYDNPIFMQRAIELGLYGYILKTASLSTLVVAIEQMIVGVKTWPPTKIRRVTGAMTTARSKAATEAALTHRELDVLLQMMQGNSNKEIAVQLKIGYETVKDHVQTILRKIGVADRVQAAVWAARKGIV